MNNVELTSNAQAVLETAERIPDELAEAIAKAMDTENQLTVGHIVKTKLSRRSATTLGVVTNRLRGSLRATKSKAKSREVTSSIGSNVRYAGVHEFGFRGTVTVGAFTRRNPRGDKFNFLARGKASRDAGIVNDYNISRKMAEALGGFGKGGRARIFLKKTSSGVSFVKAHKRKLNFPARAMVSTGIEERAENYQRTLSAAIEEAWSK